MKQYTMAGAILATAAILVVTPFSAWGEPEPGTDESSVSAAEAEAPAEAIDAAASAETSGLDLVMDGSSLEAFEKSLEKVREIGTEKEYNSLKSAFEYLLFFDLGAKRDPEILASRLDGLTGHEIVKRVKWRPGRAPTE